MIYEFRDCLTQVLDSRQLMVLPQGGMGSEDFASFSRKVPSAYLLLGAGTSGEKEVYGKPMHNPSVVFNEDILSLGSAVLAICAVNWLKNHQEN